MAIKSGYVLQSTMWLADLPMEKELTVLLEPQAPQGQATLLHLCDPLAGHEVTESLSKRLREFASEHRAVIVTASPVQIAHGSKDSYISMEIERSPALDLFQSNLRDFVRSIAKPNHFYNSLTQINMVEIAILPANSPLLGTLETIAGATRSGGEIVMSNIQLRAVFQPNLICEYSLIE